MANFETIRLLDEMKDELIVAIRARFEFSNGSTSMGGRDAEKYWEGKADGILFAMKVIDPSFKPPTVNFENSK